MSFRREHAVKAIRRDARCEACGQMIGVGNPAVRWAGMSDGDFWTGAWHPECRAAEIALNKLHDTYADEWQGLADLDHEDRDWLIAEHPIVAARKGLIAQDPRP